MTRSVPNPKAIVTRDGVSASSPGRRGQRERAARTSCAFARFDRLCMKLIAPGLLVLTLGTWAAAQPTSPPATTNPPAAKSPNPAAEEKRLCTRNLKAIYSAIEAFQADKHDLPNWLSDLVPQYLPDANVLICPVCRRTGETEESPLADPKLPCSYAFEFCPLPLGPSAPNFAGRTHREWKRRQMGLVGAQVPLVRCHHHRPVLNLSFDGKVYESPLQWERLFTNRVSAGALSPARLFADELARPGKAPAKGAARGFPARDARAGKELLNLTRFYNAQLNQPGFGVRSNALAALPRGLQTFNGVEFDVRGMIRLRGGGPPSTNFPVRVEGIPVNQKCQVVHFLHGAANGSADDGTRIGTYVVHYATNEWRVEIPIRYGREVHSVQPGPGEQAASKDLVPAWHTQRNGARAAARLFLTTWTNVAPGLEIESIDFVSNKVRPAPLLIAISVE